MNPQKVYAISREKKGVRATVRMTIPPAGRGSMPLPLHHVVRHSPDGFNFGYSGSGPSDLALSILWDCFGKIVAEEFYVDFRDHFLKPIADDIKAFSITQSEIENWIAPMGARLLKLAERARENSLIDAQIPDDAWEIISAAIKPDAVFDPDAPAGRRFS